MVEPVIRTISPGCYTTEVSREWWDDPRIDNDARTRIVAYTLRLPAERVSIMTDSSEEVDLATVWFDPSGEDADDDPYSEPVVIAGIIDDGGMIAVDLLVPIDIVYHIGQYGA